VRRGEEERGRGEGGGEEEGGREKDSWIGGVFSLKICRSEFTSLPPFSEKVLTFLHRLLSH
jgi:hypothetical protein